MSIDALKTCYRCKAEKSLDAFYADSSKVSGRCSRCITCTLEISSEKYRASHPEYRSHEERRANPIHVGTSDRTRWRIAGEKPRMCKDCRDVEVARPLWLCAACKVARLAARMGAPHRRRARMFGVEYEPINRRTVFERDGWICGVCDGDIDPTLNHPAPWSASLDHIVPMSLGGPHTYRNVQPAHLECNLSKGARVA